MMRTDKKKEFEGSVCRCQGSLTIYFSLLILTVMSLIFTMVETVRVYSMAVDAKAITHMALENAYSEYNPYIFKKYKILGMDRTEGYGGNSNANLEKRITDFGNENSNLKKLDLGYTGTNYLRMENTTSDITNYGILTDQGAAPIIEQGSSMALGAKGTFAIDKLKEYMDAYSKLPAVDINGEIGKYSDAKKKAEEEKANLEANGIETEDKSDTESNPVNAFLKFKNSFSESSLAIFMDTSNVSSKSVDSASLCSVRTLNQGNAASPDVNTADKVLYIKYMMDNFSTFQNKKNKDGLVYEIEHVLCGKGSDKKNLSSVCGYLFALRLVENVAALAAMPATAPVKLQADALASTLFSWCPPAIVFAKIAIEAMMVFAESVLDVRALLAGKKMSLIKSVTEWTFDIWDSAKLPDVTYMSKNCETGIDYNTYLAILIGVEDISKMGLRSADCMEISLNSQSDYSQVKMDDLVYQSNVVMEYEAKPLFLSWVSLGVKKPGGYGFVEEAEINYLQKINLPVGGT